MVGNRQSRWIVVIVCEFTGHSICVVETIVGDLDSSTWYEGDMEVFAGW